MSIANQPTFSATPYITPSNWRSTAEILVTLSLLFIGLWGIQLTLTGGHWLFYALAIVPVGLLFTRVFVMVHDLTHRTLYKKGWVNDVVGSILGVLVLTPFYLWRKVHLVHHKEGGNTDKRPWLGDLNVQTVREYQARTPLNKFRYRLYRNPFIMFCLGSIYVFMVDQRRSKKSTPEHPVFGRKERLSVIGTNIGILVFFGAITAWMGVKFLVLGMLIPLWLSGIMGIYLFYVQHNFRNKYFVPNTEWNLRDSAVKGSSFHDIPSILMWLTANIGYHHVHTLSTRIPFYRLPSCHHNETLFEETPRVTLRDLPTVLSYKLYDEDKKEMITWREYKERFTAQ